MAANLDISRRWCGYPEGLDRNFTMVTDPDRQNWRMERAGQPAGNLDLLESVRFGLDGLVPVIAQQWDTGVVLMLAWMDSEALRRTLATGRATYYSRSRQQYWVKGDTSGHRQRVREIALDCDGDAVLIKVDQHGPACHTGSLSCFDGPHLRLTGDLGDTA